MKMLLVFTCLWFASVCVLQAPNSKGGTKQNGAGGAHPSTDSQKSQPNSASPLPSGTIVNCNQMDSTDHAPKASQSNEDIEIQRKLATFTKYLVWVGVLQFLALAGTLIIVGQQAKLMGTHATHLESVAKAASSNAQAAILQVGAMQEQITQMSVQSAILQESVDVARNAADASLKQVNYMAATERAWIMDTRATLTAGAKDRPEGSEQVFIHCAAKNEGHSPARVLGMNAILAVGPISDPGQTWDEKLYDFPKDATPNWTILPDKSSALNVPVSGLIGQPGQTIRCPIQDGQTSFIHGVIKYWDVFSETARFTRFCYRYEETPGTFYGFYRAGGDRYNQQT